MINRKVAKRKGDSTSVADAFLEPEQGMLLGSIMGDLSYIGTLRNVRAVNQVIKQWPLRLYALAHEFGREW